MELSDQQFQELLNRAAPQRPSSETKLLEKIPGGAAGAVAACAVLVFFAKGWIDDKKLESEALVRIEKAQEIQSLKIDLLNSDVGEIKNELKEGVKDRITRTAALEKFEGVALRTSKVETDLMTRINKLETQLDYRGSDWMPSVEKRLQKLELSQLKNEKDQEKN